MTQRKHILFICTGNTCRSPMAEFVMKDLVEKAGISAQFEIASAATSTEEIGNPVVPQEQPHGPGRQPVRKRSTSSGSMASISPAMKAALLRMN